MKYKPLQHTPAVLPGAAVIIPTCRETKIEIIKLKIFEGLSVYLCWSDLEAVAGCWYLSRIYPSLSVFTSPLKSLNVFTRVNTDMISNPSIVQSTEKFCEILRVLVSEVWGRLQEIGPYPYSV